MRSTIGTFSSSLPLVLRWARRSGLHHCDFSKKIVLYFFSTLTGMFTPAHMLSLAGKVDYVQVGIFKKFNVHCSSQLLGGRIAISLALECNLPVEFFAVERVFFPFGDYLFEFGKHFICRQPVAKFYVITHISFLISWPHRGLSTGLLLSCSRF